MKRAHKVFHGAGVEDSLHDVPLSVMHVLRVPTRPPREPQHQE